MTVSRRGFLQGSLGATLASGALGGCGNPVKAAPILPLTVGPDLQARIVLPMYPDLAPVGGAVTLELTATGGAAIPGPAAGGVLLVHLTDDAGRDTYVATQATCTHLGCPVGYSTRDKLIECPCHGSRFAARKSKDYEVGAVVHRPAPQGLQQFDVTFDGANQTVIVALACVKGDPLPAAAGGTVTFALADHPALAELGGSTLAHVPAASDCLILLRVDETTVAALSSVCTHQGCDVGYSSDARKLVCPCHGSEYGLDGAVLKDPAPRPLRRYPTSFDGTRIVVTIG